MTDQLPSDDQQFAKFITAIKNGSLQQVQDILRSAPLDIVNRIEPQFRQPSLYFAALLEGDQKSSQLIKLLIRNGASVKFKDHNEQTILFYICREGKQKCAQLLLSHGLSLDDVDVYGQTPMFYAVSQNRLQLVNKYATKERVNHLDKLAKQSPLYYAARKGHLEMAMKLIEKGADVTMTDATNKTAVEYAKKAKFNEVADYLAGELRKIKEVSKSNQQQSQKRSAGRRKEETIKQAKNTYKIVFYNDKGEPHDLTEEEVKQLISSKPELAAYMSNPDSIPQQCLASMENDSWEKAATKILNLCCKMKGAYYFLEPVDPVKFNIMDYFDIVTQPMDLGTVRRKLSHNCYIQASDFVKDMNLIWQNSYRYNGEDHVVSKCGKELEASFNELVTSQGLDKFMSENQ